jgi:hypothetical protein
MVAASMMYKSLMPVSDWDVNTSIYPSSSAAAAMAAVPAVPLPRATKKASLPRLPSRNLWVRTVP